MTCSFTLDHYFDTLEQYGKAGYHIGPVSEANEWDKCLLLRHDIDLSLDYALQFAKEEYQRGYRATYYILLRSPFYNALETNSSDEIKQIAEKHEIGLHIDTRNFSVMEFVLLAEIIGKNQIDQFSQHLPNDTPPLPEYVNDVYSDAMKLTQRDYKYLSDSGKHWREGCFCQWIDKADKIMVLTHPIWWIIENLKQFNHDSGIQLSKKLRANYVAIIDYLEALFEPA